MEYLKKNILLLLKMIDICIFLMDMMLEKI